MNKNMFKMVVKPIKIDKQKFKRELIKQIDSFRMSHGLAPIMGPELGWQGMGRIPARRRTLEVIVVKTREEMRQAMTERDKEIDELDKLRELFLKW